tara:strand:- start:380 stop:637 length:258 start_codon:yes stop_codon:yes gene_type:complete
MKNNKLEMFNDTEDKDIRNNNRAAIMANTFEDNIQQGKRTTSSLGGMQVLAYFSRIPKADKAQVYKKFQGIMKQRDFIQLGQVEV